MSDIRYCVNFGLMQAIPICTPDKEQRKKRLKMIKEAGVVVQNPDGSLEALSPEAAKKRIAAMSPEVRALYEDG